MSIVDKLMALDGGKLELPTKDVEVKRLTGLFGEQALFTCKGISADVFADIQKMSLNMKNGQVKDIDMQKMKLQTLIAGVVEPSLSSKDLQAHFNCSTANDLINKLLLAGEQDELFTAINELSGYDNQEEDVSEIKN